LPPITDPDKIICAGRNDGRPKVKGFQPAQSWYQDFAKVTVE
jgi:hypothetical protein